MKRPRVDDLMIAWLVLTAVVATVVLGLVIWHVVTGDDSTPVCGYGKTLVELPMAVGKTVVMVPQCI